MMDRKTWTRRSTGRILTLAGVAGFSAHGVLVSAGGGVGGRKPREAGAPSGAGGKVPGTMGGGAAAGA